MWPTETATIYRPPKPRVASRPRRPASPSPVFLAATAPVTLEVVRVGRLSQVTATTTLGGVVYYYWYVDGELKQQGTSNRLTVALDAGAQGRIECHVSNSANWAATSAAPQSWPRTRTVRWLRSLDASCRRYRIDQAKAQPAMLTDAELVAWDLAGLTGWASWDPWAAIATIDRDADAWSYQLATQTLDDTSVYKWRIVPLSAIGNAGTPVETDPIKSSRRGDAPDFAITFAPGTQRVTFSES